jgi:hypothetical protein
VDLKVIFIKFFYKKSYFLQIDDIKILILYSNILWNKMLYLFYVVRCRQQGVHCRRLAVLLASVLQDVDTDGQLITNLKKENNLIN